MNLRNPLPFALAASLAAVFLSVTSTLAAPPDLTAGESIPSDLTTTWNLGPTGMRGWVYYDTTSGGINGSVDSRQIQVREVDSGSPADGVFLQNDLILGASGTAAAPVYFSIDARRGLAAAIADAEAQTPAHLKLIRWRAGAETVVTLTLRTMGAYSATAPYDCEKSEQILLEGMDYYYNSESSGRYRLGALSLLAAQDNLFPDRALYLQKAQTEARALIKSSSALNDLRNYTASTGYPIPWQRAHELILLGEYYLITGDSQVFDTIEALAINIAKGTSHYGTVAHSLRSGGYDASNNYRPVNTGYGVVNSIGMPCLLGVQLAKRCGVNDPVVDQMIDRAKMFYASYAKRGSIPYGEHDPFDSRHENNGKNGLAAILLDNDPVYEDQGEFFVMMALASGDTDRDVGHTGAYFNYLWAPLGVQRGGPAAVQEYFKKVSWMLDLHRRWDGGFDYDSYSENGAPNGSEYYDFRMSTAMLLTYALPLQSLHITGRNSTGALALSPAQVSDSVDVEDYDATARTTAQLVDDLAVWSPKIRLLAAAELGARSIDTATRDDIRAKAMDVNGNSRYGAIQALGEIDDTGYTSQLVSLLNDNDGYVRTLAAKALHKFPASHKMPYRSSMMTTLVSREQAPIPPVSDDPLQFDQAALITAIFGSGAFANSRSEMDTLIGEVGSPLFFDALKAASRHPSGNARGRVNNLYKVLTPAEVNLMAPELVDMLALESPADRMFSLGVRAEAMRAMQRSLVAEAVPAAMQAMDNSNGWGGFHEDLLNVLVGYGGSSTLVTPDPDVVGFAQRYLTGGTVEEAQAVLDAIAADTNPTPPTAFKSIVSASADDPILTLPANSTVLRVSGLDYLQGDSIYTWNKIAGPGNVTFTPNGTADLASTVQFDGTAGTYQFEVTMSDSLGFTEVHETVTVFLQDEGAADNDPPLPNPASFAMAPAADSETAVSMTAVTGSDASGPVEYLFSEITGNPGGTSSGWQTSPSYTDSGLSPLTDYAYMVTMRDSLGNAGTTSSAVGVTTPGTPPPSDIISVNFYAYGRLATEDRHQVTLEANETAGFGGWRTGGWENYEVPWGLSSPRPPVSISSGLGSTATLTLNDVRNGTPYNNPNPHALLPGDGNGDLMDGHCNGTEDPYDESAKFDMVVSGVPFGTYDVIVYVGANRAQFGDGTGKFVFNGVAEQNFKLTSGEFMAFAEITNGTTPGNYILFENVTGSSFSLRMWGNGFNHIGPTGFQIASAGTTSDVEPPTPNPASFATPPYAAGANSISMTATTGSDASGPVEYLFSCLTAGGHGSGWQSSPSYTDGGLNPGTQYTYTVTMRDARGNTGNASNPASATTLAGADVTAPNPNPMTWAVVPAAGSDEPVVHEGFDYGTGVLTGNGGTGFASAWSTTTDRGTNLFNVQSPGLSFADGGANVLPVAGNRASRSASQRRAEANRQLSAAARAALFADDSTMWFSVLYQKTDGSENAAFVIGSDTFDVANYSDVNGYTSGNDEGFGFGSSSAEIAALGYDDSDGMTKVDYALDLGTVRLIAGKIVWSGNGANDTLHLYNVSDLTTEPTVAIATVALDLDQSTFDQIALLGQRSSAVFDEIRLGTSFAAVVGGGSGNTDSTISMTATPASDDSGVEYYFTETSGRPGGSDSGWQDSPAYVDTGLQPGTEYTYTVTARDKSGQQNTTAPSVAASATTTGVAPNSFANYISNPAFGLDPAERGFEDDPDGDGIPNGMENFFGTNPSLAEASGMNAMAVITGGDSSFLFTHPQNAAHADDISAYYEWSTSVQTYHADGASNGTGTTVNFSTQPDTPAVGMTTVTATITGTLVDRFFVRLGVVQN
jgi:hypothetical protein